MSSGAIGNPVRGLPTTAEDLPWHVALGVALVIPWVSPVTWGPIAGAIQSLLCAAALAVVLLWRARAGGRSDHTLTEVVAHAWLMAAAISALAGLLQYFGASDTLGAAWVDHAPAGVAYANLRQRNQFASLTSMGLVALVYLATQQKDMEQTWHRRVALGVLLLLLAAGNAASASRTGALQWLLLAALCLLWQRNGTQGAGRWGLAACALYLLCSLVLPWLLQDALHISSANALARIQEPSGCESRLVLWRNVLELVAQKPWLGWGWGTLKLAHFMHPFVTPRFCAILDNAHNLPLHLAYCFGIPAALAVLLALGLLLWRAQPWRETLGARQLAWGVLAVLALHSLLEYPLWYGPFQLALGLALWLLFRHARASAPPTSAAPESGAPASVPRAPVQAGWNRRLVLVALALCVLTLTVAWDYRRVAQLYLNPEQRAPEYRSNTLEKAGATWWFQDEFHFAALTTTSLGPENAEQVYALALQTLPFSPEPAVLQPLLSSAAMGHHDNALTQDIAARAHAVYPKDF